MSQDLYAVLGVASDATDAEIKRAYRALAREHHPDARPGDPEAEARFKEISTAYAVLGDPEKRRRYDTFGTTGAGAGGGPGPGAGDPFGFGDIFDAFFGQGSPFGGAEQPRRAEDVAVALGMTLGEVATGTTRTFDVRMPIECPTCDASGARPGTHPSVCGQCGGSGQVRQVRRSMLGQMMTTAVCARCGGTGMEISDPCPECRGDGRVVGDTEITVEVPAGIEDGQRLRLTGRGPVGPRGGPRGDVYVDVTVEPDPRFERDGDDLHTGVSVPFTMATLGGATSVETLDEPYEVSIAAGTQPGTVVCARGRGLPPLRGRRKGDLYVHLTVEVPDDLDEEQEELLRRLAELRGEPVDPERAGFVDRVKSAFR